MRYFTLCFTLLLVAFAIGQEKEKPLTAEDIEKALENKKVFFLDVREPKELEELGTLEGYTNIPVSQIESRLSEIPKDKLILTA